MAIVEIDRLTFTYPRASAPAVADVSLDVQAGEFVLVVGPSGCGKSTVLGAVAALVPHFSGGRMAGAVRVAGRDTRETKPAELAGTVGVVFQDPEAQVVSSSVAGELAFGLENLGVPPERMVVRTEETAVALDVSSLRGARLAELSGGQLQRVVLAAVLAMRPEVLLLDEPTSQLDPVAAEGLLASLRRLSEEVGTTIILAEHRLERCFHWADRVVMMEGGRMVREGSPRDVAAWALSAGSVFVPPVSTILHGIADGDAPVDVPLTVKEAREAVARLAGGNREQTWAPMGAQTGAQTRAQAEAQAGARTTKAPHAPWPGPAAVSVRGLTHTYPTGTVALRDVDLTVHPGECVVLMGENGAGKSTLLRHLNGLLRAQRGSIELSGRPVGATPTEDLARDIAILGQHPGDYLFSGTVAEELSHTLANLGIEDDTQGRIASTLDSLGIAGLAGADPRSLSVGERQRVALASLLVARPRIVGLDEPTRGMDPADKRALAKLIESMCAQGSAVILVTHDVEFAATVARRAVVMARGGVIADGPLCELMEGGLFLSTQAGRTMCGFARGIVTVTEAREVIEGWVG